MNVFNKFAPFIRDYIYSNGWQELREVQIEAAEVIFNSDDNLLICSRTASGKTEAAFFPMISDICSNPTTGFGILYIAPLKALINDQFDRLREVLEMSEMPLYHWHGDVASSLKDKAIKNPEGILQITPESLESMLMNRPNDIPRLFSGLRYIVIDELHSLMGSDRGGQIMCQIKRIEALIKKSPRRIGLSATVGDKTNAASWLSSGSERVTAITRGSEDSGRWRLATEHFFIQDREFDRVKDEEKSSGDYKTNENIETLPREDIKDKPKFDAGYEFVYNCTRNKRCIVFSNSREETEYATATLRQIADHRREEDRFLIHHGNLSASIREDVEEKLKNGEEKYTACATVTLELGIDIGELERIVHIDAPNTVSGFLQRLGRSGRRNEPSEMVMVIREEEALPNEPVQNIIPWALIRSIAIVELYSKEKFIEPVHIKKMPLSLLFQQTLSLLASKGGMKGSSLAANILSMPPFVHVPREVYRELLVFMKDGDYIELTENKNYIVGLKGERLINSFKFYASFKDSDDFTVRCGSEEIGTVNSAPPVGDRFALAGRAWEVEEVDLERKLIYTKPIEGKMEVSWPGDYGIIHTRILEKMKEVLCGNEEYSYLRPNARKRLDEARSTARNIGLAFNSVVSLGGISYCMFDWLGTLSHRAMRRILVKYAEPLGISSVEYGAYHISFKMQKCKGKDLFFRLKQLIEKDGGIDPEELLSPSEAPAFDKYDPILPPDLLRFAYSVDRMDVEEALSRIESEGIF